MASRLDRIKEALQSPLRLWAALAIAVAVVVLLSVGRWVFSGGDDPGAVKRWSHGGGLEETGPFAAAIHHQQDQGRWQSKARQSDMKAESNAFVDGCDQKREGEGAAALDYAYPLVSIYSSPNIHPPQTRATLRDLGDLAQASVVDAIEQASKTQSHPWDDLQKALSNEDKPGEKDPFLFERVLVATVAKGTKWPPGDRMVWTRIFVQPCNFKFAAYTIAATESETVKVSSVEATNVRKLSADIGLTVPSMEGSKLGLSPSSERTIKTTSETSTQYERLGVDIMSSFLRIMRESAVGGDVIGNTTVALSLTTDPVQILRGSKNDTDTHLKDPGLSLVVTGAHLDDDEKTPSMEVLPLIPLPHCPLWANIWAIYEQRHIQEHNDFYDEARQTVGFIHDVDGPRTVEVMGADDVSPFVWSIQVLKKGAKPDNNWRKQQKALNAKFGKNGSWRQLLFSDYGKAVKLAHWVRTHPDVDLSGYHFNFRRDEGLAVIKQTADDCTGDVIRPTLEADDETR